jgi:YD repeat-containing protein
MNFMNRIPNRDNLRQLLPVEDALGQTRPDRPRDSFPAIDRFICGTSRVAGANISTLASILGLVFLISLGTRPLLAQTGFTGQSVTVDYEWPSLGQILYNGGTAVVAANGTTYLLPGQGGTGATITGSTIVISSPAGWYFNTVNPKTFDGWVITDLAANITGATLTTTNIPGLSASAITSDSQHVYVNFLGFSSLPTGFSLTITVSFAAGSTTQVLPQLAFGGGWYTALYFTNLTNTAVSFQVNFIGDSGSPLNVSAVGGSSATVNLAARGTAVIQIPNSGPLSDGYVVASLPTGVTGYGIFRESIPGVPDQEAVVPLSPVTAAASTLLFDDTSYVTGVAIVNLSNASNTVTATAYDSQGNIIGTASIALPAGGKVSQQLRNIPGLSGVAGNLGSVDFSVPTGNVAALGLRFNGRAFTSIPVYGR